MKRRVGNDIGMQWTILRNGEAEDFSSATDMILSARCGNYSLTLTQNRTLNVFLIDIPAASLYIGVWDLVLTYKIGTDAYAVDDKEAFEVVAYTEEEDLEGQMVIGSIGTYPDPTKAQIEAALTGVISTHSHLQKLKYRYYIGSQGDFLTIPLAIAWLETNMLGNSELLIDSGDYDISDTIAIDLPYHLSIRGFDSNSAFLNAATGLTGKPMFQITSSVYLERICFDGSTLASYGTLSTENCIEILGTQYHELTAFLIKNFYDGIKLIGAGKLWVFNSVFEDIPGQGVRVFSDGATSIDIETNTFKNCGNSIGLMKSTAGEFHLINNLFINSAGQTGIVYDPANFIYTDDPVVAGNTWNNVGTFSSGADYSRADGRDANIYVRGNSGREDKMPHFKVNVINNTSATTVTTAGTFYKAVFTNGLAYTCKWKLENNKYTYQPRNRSDVPVWLSGVVSTNGTNKNVDIAFRKSGVATQISPITIRCAVASQPYSFGVIAYIQDMGPGDFIEIFLTSSSNGDLVTIQDLTLYADSK